jgi:glycosyltransferase involved in cell wall biosynthesis
MFDYIFVTHLPSFYKINLYNELSKHKKIFVIFVADNAKNRTKDFVDFSCQFEYEILTNGEFEKRNKFVSIMKLVAVFKKLQYKRLVVGGWDLWEFWILIFLSRKNKNCLALESTFVDSKSSGSKAFIKKMFLRRISLVFASGQMHKKLLDNLNYQGVCKFTRGVGLINKPIREFVKHEYKKRFLFLGRLSEEKNLNFLINIFNSMSDYCLTIVGNGHLKEVLKNMAKENISFVEHIENNKIKELFQNNDFLILPSLTEPWGLVVEEALYFGLPVLVSKNCGVVELVEDNVNGFITDPQDQEISRNIILKIDNNVYQNLITSVINSNMIEKKDIEQIKAYL